MRVCLAIAMLPATSSAWSAQKGSLTLVCNGTYDAQTFGGILTQTVESRNDVKDLGVVINFSEQEVESVRFSGHITGIDGASIAFKNPGDSLPMGGTFDSVSGKVEAYELVSRSDGEKTNYFYHLQCKSTKRMF
jgi:hypothetical protein